MTIQIRLLTGADAGLLDRVADDVFDAAIDHDRLRAYLATPGHHMVVALKDGLVIGQVAAVVHHHPDTVTELYIDNVGVAPSYQRQGIARRMLDAMYALGVELGCERTWVGAEPDNGPGRALYERYGCAPEPFVIYARAL